MGGPIEGFKGREVWVCERDGRECTVAYCYGLSLAELGGEGLGKLGLGTD